MGKDFISDEEMDQISPPKNRGVASNSSPQFISDEEFVPDDEKYSSLGQQGLAGLESAAAGASLGLSHALEVKSGLTTPEAIRGREEQNPGTALLGTLAGAGALAGLTGGFGGLASGIEGAVGGLGGKALAGAAEGAIFGAGNAVSDAALGDPHLNAQKVIAHIGIGALGGGILSGGIGALSKSIKAVPALLRGTGEGATQVPGGVSAEQALSDVGLGNSVPETLAEKANPDSPLRQSVPLDQLDPQDQKPIIDGLNHLKPNVDEIIESGRILNAPTPEGMLSNSEHIQKIDYALTNSPSPNGLSRNKLYNEAYEAASKTFSGALGEGSDLSQVEAGNQAKQLLSDRIETKYQPIKDLYSAIEEKAPDVPLSGENTQVSKNISKIIEDQSLIEGTAEHSFVKTFANGLDKVENLAQLKNYRTALGRASKGNPEVKYVAGLIQDKLDNLEVNAIERHADLLTDPVEKQAIEALANNLKTARGQYKAFRDEIGKIGKVLWGGKRIYGPQDFLDKIEAETPERFSEKLFSKKNSEALSFLNQNFPEVTQLLSQLEKSKIREASQTKGVFSPVKALNNLKKISPEVKAVMFTPEEQRVLQAGKVYFDNFLPNFNPSGTAGALSYHQAFAVNPKGYSLNALKDFGLSAYIKHSVNLSPEQRAAAQLNLDKNIKLNALQGMIQKIDKAITSGAKTALEKAGGKNFIRGALSGGSALLSNEEYKKIVKDIHEKVGNPEALLDDLSKASLDLYHAAPDITQNLQTSAVKSLTFLNSKIPQSGGDYLLSKHEGPTREQLSTFSRYWDAANHPTKAFEQIAHGNLSNEAMETYQTLYPELLQHMQQTMLSQIRPEKLQKLPYSQKLNISKFLGQPLDGNMTPQSILANQKAFGTPGQNKDNIAQPRPDLAPIRASQSGLKHLDLAGRAKPFGSRSMNDLDG